MKKAILSLALVSSVSIAVADDAKKVVVLQEAIDRAFDTAKQVTDVTTIVDSHGCLWGISEKDGQVRAIGIADKTGKQYCRPIK